MNFNTRRERLGTKRGQHFRGWSPLIEKTIPSHRDKSMEQKFFQIKKSIVAALACLLILGGCRKEQDVYIPYGQTVDALRALMTSLTSDPANAAQFEIDGSNSSVEFTSPRGVKVLMTDVNGLFVDSNGLPVEASAGQKITLKISDVLEKPEVAGLGNVTQADFGQPLETAGMVKIEAFFNGKPIKLRDDRTFEVRIPVGPAGAQADFFAFEGGWSKSSGEARFRWSQADDVTAPAIQPIPDGVTYYQLSVKKLGWLAANHPLPNPVANLSVKLSDEFTLTNTLGFLVLDGSKTVLPLRYDSANNLFKADKLPNRVDGKLVFTSKILDQLYVVSRGITTEENQSVDLSTGMKAVGEDGLKDMLLSLK